MQPYGEGTQMRPSELDSPRAFLTDHRSAITDFDFGSGSALLTLPPSPPPGLGQVASTHTCLFFLFQLEESTYLFLGRHFFLSLFVIRASFNWSINRVIELSSFTMKLL